MIGGERYGAADGSRSAPRGGQSLGRPERILLMTDDGEILDTVLRLAAAAGVEVFRAADTAEARRHWVHSPLVLLDGAWIERCARSNLPQRGRIVLVAHDQPPEELARAAAELGAEHAVAVPEGESWLVQALADAIDPAPPADGTGRVLAVVGGRGGAGASLLSAAVAVASAREAGPTLLVDCDPLGGGLDLVLGAEQVTGLRWPDITVTEGRIPVGALHAAIPAPAIDRAAGELGLLSCARAAKGPTADALTAVVEAGRRAGETVVCDVPRYPTDPAIAALAAADLTVLVVPADVRSCAAAGRVAAVLREQTARLGLVVRGPAPGGIGPEDMAEALDLPVIAAMAAERRLAADTDRGRPPGLGRGPLAKAARAVLAALHSPALGQPAERLGMRNGVRLAEPGWWQS